MRQNVFKTSAYALSALAVLVFAAPSFAQVNVGTGANVGVGAGGANAGVNTNSKANTNMKSSTKGSTHAQGGSSTKMHSKSQAQAPGMKAGTHAGANGNATVK